MTKAVVINPYPFGSAMPTRGWSDANRQYRYGFNGKEKDFETANDDYDFGARILDTRLGRWLSLDPLKYKFAFYCAYQYSANQPISSMDIEGKEPSNDLNPFIRFIVWPENFSADQIETINAVLRTMYSSDVFDKVQKAAGALNICDITVVGKEAGGTPSSLGYQNSGMGAIFLPIDIVSNKALLATTIVYETQNIANDKAYIELNNKARAGSITKKDFVEGYFKLEALATLRAMEFQFENPEFNDGRYKAFEKIFKDFKDGKLKNLNTKKNMTEQEFIDFIIAPTLMHQNPAIREAYEKYYDNYSSESKSEGSNDNDNDNSSEDAESDNGSSSNDASESNLGNETNDCN